MCCILASCYCFFINSCGAYVIYWFQGSGGGKEEDSTAAKTEEEKTKQLKKDAKKAIDLSLHLCLLLDLWQAITDAGAKIQWAISLKPNLDSMQTTQRFENYDITAVSSSLLRSEKYAASIREDVETKQSQLEAYKAHA